MIVMSSRFGVLEVPESKVLTFPNGLIGFPAGKRFVLVERGSAVVWLQCVDDPALAFPAVEATHLGPSYPKRPVADVARDAGLGPGRYLVLLVVHLAAGALCANMLAPVLVELRSREGAQVVLDPDEYDTSVPLSQLRAMIVTPRARVEARANSA
jgi:flagellar assembly factor FliW